MSELANWQTVFNPIQAAEYKNECFTQNTQEELRFLVKELDLPSGARVLDLGCGTGRHSVGLAAAGLQVTGVDFSEHMLEMARQAAEKAGVSLTLIQANAADITFEACFDAAICLCEGGMCLLGAEDDPLTRDDAILGNIYRALKPDGRLVVNALSACRIIRAMSYDDVASGRFDPRTLVETYPFPVKGGEGRTVMVRERYYTGPEFMRMLQGAGFKVQGLYGGTAGAWHKGPIKLDEYEMMAIALK